MGYIYDPSYIVSWTSCSREDFVSTRKFLLQTFKKWVWEDLRHIHSSLSAKKIKVADFQISEELLSSSNHASNRYKMFLMEKRTEKEHTVRGKEKKSSEWGTWSAKKKEELESVAKKLIDTADKKD